jgi:hypothetical protein
VNHRSFTLLGKGRHPFIEYLGLGLFLVIWGLLIGCIAQQVWKHCLVLITGPVVPNISTQAHRKSFVLEHWS